MTIPHKQNASAATINEHKNVNPVSVKNKDAPSLVNQGKNLSSAQPPSDTHKNTSFAGGVEKNVPPSLNQGQKLPPSKNTPPVANLVESAQPQSRQGKNIPPIVNPAKSAQSPSKQGKNTPPVVNPGKNAQPLSLKQDKNTFPQPMLPLKTQQLDSVKDKNDVKPVDVRSEGVSEPKKTEVMSDG